MGTFYAVGVALVMSFAAPLFAGTAQSGNQTVQTTETQAAAAASSTSSMEAQIEQMKRMIQAEAKQLQEQQQEILALQAKLHAAEAASASKDGTAVVMAAVDRTTGTLNATPAAPLETAVAMEKPQPQPTAAAQVAGEEQPPLSFRIGKANFTPLGFLDLTTVFRSTTVGSGIGTNFGSIPFNPSSPQGRLTETRFSAQNSRVGLRVDGQAGHAKLTGYLEADFLGNAPANLHVSSNSATLRMRLYWVDAEWNKWEFLAGQSWSLLTPNRHGISPLPADIFFSMDMDTNYQVGLTWTRAPQVRAVYHADRNWTLAASLENPQQYTGSAVTFPGAFNTAQVENGSNTSTPNVGPDVIAKVAYDKTIHGRAMHVEAAGLFSTFRLNSGTQNVTTIGGGVSVNMNLELAPNFRLIANSFWSDGGGRYIFGLGPDFVVTTNPNGLFRPTPLHAGSGVAGFEYLFRPDTSLYAYYGGAYFGRAYQLENGTSGPNYVGYGYPESPDTQNRAIQEATLGFVQTLWKDRNYGAIQLITQGSYLVRTPWSIAQTPGFAKNAHLGMGYVDVRYVLP